MSICKEWVGKKQMFIPTCDICGAQLHEQYYFTDADGYCYRGRGR